eukprot:5340351-Amphidinium_carterae.1
MPPNPKYYVFTVVRISFLKNIDVGECILFSVGVPLIVFWKSRIMKDGFHVFDFGVHPEADNIEEAQPSPKINIERSLIEEVVIAHFLMLLGRGV